MMNENVKSKLRRWGAGVGGAAALVGSGAVLAEGAPYATAAATALDGSHADINLVLASVMGCVILLVVFGMIKSGAKK